MIKVNARKLKQVVDAAYEIAEKGDKPIVSFIHLLCEGDGILTVSATNYSAELSAWAEADGDAMVAMVNAAAFRKVIALAPDDCAVTLDATDRALALTYDGSDFSLPSLDPKSFPERYPVDPSALFPASPELIGAIANAAPFALTDTSRPSICGVWIDNQKTGCAVMATDGHRMAFTEIEIPGAKPGAYMIGSDAADSIIANTQRFGADGAKISLFRGNDTCRCSFTVGPVTITGRTSEHTLLDWRRALAVAARSVSVKAEIAPLMDRIRRALAIGTSDKIEMLRLSINGGDIDVSAKAVLAASKSRATVQGLDFGFSGAININPKYLLHALQLVGKDTVSMCIGQSTDPMTMTFDAIPNFCVVLMPMRD